MVEMISKRLLDYKNRAHRGLEEGISLRYGISHTTQPSLQDCTFAV